MDENGSNGRDATGPRTRVTDRRAELLGTAARGVAIVGLAATVAGFALAFLGYDAALYVAALGPIVAANAALVGEIVDPDSSETSAEVETTVLEGLFEDHPRVRDAVLVAIVFVPWVPFATIVWDATVRWAVGIGLWFTVVFLPWMELHARRNGDSMFRSIGCDPLD